MINNRQNGRRRGRGGQRPGGGGNPGRPESGNRIDSRARGNAGQLLEKYKALAADAARQGDRVNTEYYLQFADHYFRVLAESRPRFEEQQAQRRGDAFDDEFEGDGDDFGQEGEAGTPDQMHARDDRFRQERPRQDRQDRQDRGGQDRGGQERNGQERNGQERGGQDRQDGRREGRPRFDEARNDGRQRQDDGRQGEGRGNDGRREGGRNGPANGIGAVNGAAERPDAIVTGAPTGDEVLTRPDPATQEASTARAADMPVEAAAPDAPAPRRRGRPPRQRVEEAAEAPAGFDAALLPPSLSVSASAEPDTADGAEPAEKPRRRRRLAAPAEAGSAS